MGEFNNNSSNNINDGDDDLAHNRPAIEQLGNYGEAHMHHPHGNAAELIQPASNMGDVQLLQEHDDIVQVVYQSSQNGALVGVESSLIERQCFDAAPNYGGLPMSGGLAAHEINPSEQASGIPSAHQQLQQQSRTTSTLPSVAEESSSAGVGYPAEEAFSANLQGELADEATSRSNSQPEDLFIDEIVSEQQPGVVYQTNNSFYEAPYEQQPSDYYADQSATPVDLNAIYSTVSRQNRQPRANDLDSIAQVSESSKPGVLYETSATDECTSTLYNSVYEQKLSQPYEETEVSEQTVRQQFNVEEVEGTKYKSEKEELEESERENLDPSNEDLSHILMRHGQGAAESGSLKNNFRKKLGVSVSTNETDLTAHRQKLLESRETNEDNNEEEEDPGSLPSKFKRTHSVSFNVGSTRSGRHSVDIRNLPSYLTVKRASIVDVAKGAMNSLLSSFGSGGASSAGSQRRDSSPDEEPIFEEPIAPTLSLGQRVALVKNNGAEFGTVGWIGQLPDVDDDWIVGVIFDNMIGNSDGTYNGVRYFYARENYCMFVPLSSLTKTDNYIGRPETGTMLSRMSVSLKPGQLISIQRSSIRLQHCFLNAPHQRVGHDVRAVSNRLHCQCHNCGPCAHLTKQGRVSAIPPFGAHHAPNKKNSLAHAAVEILAHHHHHYHEEEHKDEEDYQFGDNAAHACNFVRYSCCQQTGAPGHDFSADCGMVRPELLDNLIHAPRAPHRRSRPRRRHLNRAAAIEGGGKHLELAPNNTLSTLESGTTMRSITDGTSQQESESSYSSCSSRSSSPGRGYNNNYPDPGYDSSNYNQAGSVFNTVDERYSILDQHRFICQRDSSVLVRSQPSYLSDEDDYRSSGFGSSIRRCWNCLWGRQQPTRKQKRRRMSARNRKLEHRRKQFTFVPSTLAKPHEGFASQSLAPPVTALQESNSDYSSYSKSSGSSRSNSLDNQGAKSGALLQDTSNNVQAQYQMMTMELESPAPNEQLKSSYNVFEDRAPQLDYADYTFSDGYGSYKKNDCSYDSALTDMGYFDTLTNNSNDTLKNIVEQTINEQVSPPEPFVFENDFSMASPIQSAVGSNESEQIDISSPTASVVDQIDEERLCHEVDSLDLDKKEGPPNC